VKPGGLRELHWHPNADEWQYNVKGTARMTVFSAGGHARTMDFHPGDVGYIDQSLPHYVEDIGRHRSAVSGGIPDRRVPGYFAG
jgi:oxalate decarboxylase